jgi:hypothetical protein
MSEKQEEYNAGDAAQVNKRQKSQKTRDLQKKAALRKLMGEPEGRMWMWGLLTRCGAFRLSFATDALIMAFNEGRRDIGNHLMAEITRLSPELYMKMVVEAQQEEKAKADTDAPS